MKERRVYRKGGGRAAPSIVVSKKLLTFDIFAK